MDKCLKCGLPERQQAMNAVCDLRPMDSFHSPCALKAAEHVVDLDDLPENLVVLVPPKPRQPSKKKTRKRVT